LSPEAQGASDFYTQAILQNIAACYPLLSGHLSSQPFDSVWRCILAVHCSSSLLRKSIRPRKQSSHSH
jgi:hypothetical protein